MLKTKPLLLITAVASIATTLIFINLNSSKDEKVKKQSNKTVLDIKKAPKKEVKPEKRYGYSLKNHEFIKGKIKPNQSLSLLLGNFNIPIQTVYKLAEKSKEVYDVRKIRANQPYEVICSKDSSHIAKCFVYHPNPIDYVIFNLEDTLGVTLGQVKVDTVEKRLSGVITNSLYQTIVDAGGSPALAHELSEVYAWQIDFFGIQKGDYFTVIYDQKEVKGKAVGISKIKAAKFNHYEKNYYAFIYDQGNGEEYFDEEGNSLKKAFLKAPLKYSRISSHFSNSRLHPVLKIRRPHHGVDYAAPIGTPVHAIGDGQVIYARYAGGAGYYIKIKHNSVYTTGYMHLSKFEKGIKVGKQVKQGDVIAYVGSTGLSTGPHLDFRFWKNGTAINPLKVDPPSVDPIKKEHLASFQKHINNWKKQLSQEKKTIQTPKPEDISLINR